MQEQLNHTLLARMLVREAIDDLLKKHAKILRGDGVTGDGVRSHIPTNPAPETGNQV